MRGGGRHGGGRAGARRDRSHRRRGPGGERAGRQRQGREARVHLLRDRRRRLDVQERGQGVPGPRRPSRTPTAASTAARSRWRSIDDESTAANLTAAQDLVQNRDVFAVVNNSSFAFLSYRYMLDQGVPMIGGGFDGTYYTQKATRTSSPRLGSGTPFPGLIVHHHAQGDEAARRQEDRRARPTARRRRRAASAKTLQRLRGAARWVSRASTLNNDGRVRQHRRRAARARHQELGGRRRCTCRSTRGTATSRSCRGAAQNGVEMKANMLATGYGQDLPRPAGRQDARRRTTVLFQTYKPVELKDKATKQFQADLKKYAGLTGVPDYGVYTGYITCELAILGLQNAGKTPTRQGFIDGLRKLGSYDAAGLDLHAGRHQPTSTSALSPETSCLVLHVREGREVRGDQQGQAVHRASSSARRRHRRPTQPATSSSAVTTTTAAPAP